MNCFVLVGNLTADPEIVKLDGGKIKINFSVAYNDPYQKDDSKKTSFFNCEMWGNRGEAFAKFHAKGDKVCIQGRVLQERWEKDGEKRSAMKVKAENFDFVKTKAEAGAPAIKPEEVPF